MYLLSYILYTEQFFIRFILVLILFIFLREERISEI